MEEQIAKKMGGEFIKRDKKGYHWKCKRDHYFILSLRKIKYRGKWCRRCGNSKGERIISDLLEELHIKYDKEFHLDLLPNRRYDFYFELSGKKYLVEYDGIQHFQRVPKYHKKKGSFEFNQMIDRLKTLTAIISNHILIRIDYTKENDILFHLLNGIKCSDSIYYSDINKYEYLYNTDIPYDFIKKNSKIII